MASSIENDIYFIKISTTNEFDEFQGRVKEILDKKFDLCIELSPVDLNPYAEKLSSIQNLLFQINRTLVICTKHIEWVSKFPHLNLVPTKQECIDYIEFDRIEREILQQQKKEEN